MTDLNLIGVQELQRLKAETLKTLDEVFCAIEESSVPEIKIAPAIFKNTMGKETVTSDMIWSLLLSLQLSAENNKDNFPPAESGKEYLHYANTCIAYVIENIDKITLGQFLPCEVSSFLQGNLVFATIVTLFYYAAVTRLKNEKMSIC